jgi:hypothetical protein
LGPLGDRDEAVLDRELADEADCEAHDGSYSELESSREFSSSSMKAPRDSAVSFDEVTSESCSEPQSSSSQGSEELADASRDESESSPPGVVKWCASRAS